MINKFSIFSGLPFCLLNQLCPCVVIVAGQRVKRPCAGAVVLAVPGPGVGVGLLVGVEAALVVSVEQLVVAEPGGGGGHAGAGAGLLASAGAARGGRAAEG